MSLISSTNDECCHALVKHPTKGKAFTAFNKGRVIFLREVENDNGKNVIKAFSRCSRKKKNTDEEELCWKHSTVTDIINIVEVTEKNGFSLADDSSDYFDKIKNKKTLTKKNKNIMSIVDQQNIKKIMTSQFSKDFEKIIIDFLDKIDKLNNSILEVTDSENEEIDKTFDSDNEDNVDELLQNNIKQIHLTLNQSSDEEDELPKPDVNSSDEEDELPKPEVNSSDEEDELPEPEVNSSVLEEILKPEVNLSIVDEDEDEELSKPELNSSDEDEDNKLDEGYVSSETVIREDSDDDDEEDLLNTMTKIYINTDFRDSKCKNIDELKDSVFYLDDENQKVYNEKNEFLGYLLKISYKNAPFIMNKNKYTIVYEEKYEDNLYNICLLTNKIYDVETNKVIGFKKDDVLSFKKDKKSSKKDKKTSKKDKKSLKKDNKSSKKDKKSSKKNNKTSKKDKKSSNAKASNAKASNAKASGAEASSVGVSGAKASPHPYKRRKA